MSAPASDPIGTTWSPIRSKRAAGGGAIATTLDEAALLRPLRWRTARRVFVCPDADLFAACVPDDAIMMVFAIMALRPDDAFLCLTNRQDRVGTFLARLDAITDRPWLTDERRHGAARQIRFCLEVLERTVPAMPSRQQPGDAWPLPNLTMGPKFDHRRLA